MPNTANSSASSNSLLVPAEAARRSVAWAISADFRPADHFAVDSLFFLVDLAIDRAQNARMAFI